MHRHGIEHPFYASPMVQGSEDWNWLGGTPSSSILENAAEKLGDASV